MADASEHTMGIYLAAVRKAVRAWMAITVMIPLIAGCATSSSREDTAEAAPPPAWQAMGTVPVPTDVREIIELQMITSIPRRIPSDYRLFGDLTNYAFAVSTTAPATAALDFLDKDESDGWAWQWALTATIPPEPRAELGPHAPSGFTAPLPGGPYVASTMNGPAGSANYTLYISSDVIIVAGHSDRPAILRGVEGIKTQDSRRTRIDNQDTSIVVANGTTGSSFVAVAGPETARRQIIDLVDWDYWALQ